VAESRGVQSDHVAAICKEGSSAASAAGKGSRMETETDSNSSVSGLPPGSALGQYLARSIRTANASTQQRLATQPAAQAGWQSIGTALAQETREGKSLGSIAKAGKPSPQPSVSQRRRYTQGEDMLGSRTVPRRSRARPGVLQVARGWLQGSIVAAVEGNVDGSDPAYEEARDIDDARRVPGWGEGHTATDQYEHEEDGLPGMFSGPGASSASLMGAINQGMPPPDVFAPNSDRADGRIEAPLSTARIYGDAAIAAEAVGRLDGMGIGIAASEGERQPQHSAESSDDDRSGPRVRVSVRQPGRSHLTRNGQDDSPVHNDNLQARGSRSDSGSSSDGGRERLIVSVRRLDHSNDSNSTNEEFDRASGSSHGDTAVPPHAGERRDRNDSLSNSQVRQVQDAARHLVPSDTSSEMLDTSETTDSSGR